MKSYFLEIIRIGMIKTKLYCIDDAFKVFKQTLFIPVPFQLYTTHDTHDVCNLWPESFFGTRPDRYICFARNPIHEYLVGTGQSLQMHQFTVSVNI